MALGLGSLIGAGIGAASGAAKSSANQAKKDKAMQLAAETARYSPWTGMDAGSAIQGASGMEGGNTFGDMLQGGFSGGITGGNVEQSSAWNDLLRGRAEKMNAEDLMDKYAKGTATPPSYSLGGNLGLWPRA